MTEYTCVNCKGVFTSTWSEAEADIEMQEVFTVAYERKDCATVCDDCYKAFMETFERETK